MATNAHGPKEDINKGNKVSVARRRAAQTFGGDYARFSVQDNTSTMFSRDQFIRKATEGGKAPEEIQVMLTAIYERAEHTSGVVGRKLKPAWIDSLEALSEIANSPKPSTKEQVAHFKATRAERGVSEFLHTKLMLACDTLARSFDFLVLPMDDDGDPDRQ